MKKGILIAGGIGACIVALVWVMLVTHQKQKPLPAKPVPRNVFCDEQPDWEACFEEKYAGLEAKKLFDFQNKNPESGAIKRYIRTNYTIQNLENRPAGRLDLWTYLPTANIPGQRLVQVKVSVPGKVTMDSFGSRILLLEMKDFAAYETRIVQILMSLVLFGDSNPASSSPEQEYLSEERLIETRDPGVVKIARRLKRKTATETAKSIFDYVTAKIATHGYDTRDRGALWALSNKRGDCTEMALLFTALCRANGIPTRTLTGYVAARDRVVKAQDLHNWAQFFDEGHWHLADPFYGNFKSRSKDYVAMEIFRGEQRNPIRTYHMYRFDAHGVRFQLSY